MNASLKRYALFLTPYYVLTGTTYLWAYWSSFRVNFFEYANLTDITVAILPIAPLFLILLMAIPLKFFMFTAMGDRELKPPSLFTIALDALTILFVFFWLLMNSSPVDGWWIVILLVGPIGMSLLRTSLLSEIVNKPLRAALIFFISSIPFNAVWMGKMHAGNVLAETGYIFTSIENAKVRKVGYLGDKFFFVNRENTRLFILSGNATQKLVLERQPWGPPVKIYDLIIDAENTKKE